VIGQIGHSVAIAVAQASQWRPGAGGEGESTVGNRPNDGLSNRCTQGEGAGLPSGRASPEHVARQCVAAGLCQPARHRALVGAGRAIECQANRQLPDNPDEPIGNRLAARGESLLTDMV